MPSHVYTLLSTLGQNWSLEDDSEEKTFLQHTFINNDCKSTEHDA